jgi:hypothetical protein
MEYFWQVLIFLAIAAFLLRPVFRGFKQGLEGTDEVSMTTGAPRDFATEVVGESHYQKNLLAIAGKKTPDGVEKYVQAVLVLEDSNPHDSNAVRVEIDDKTVGYLSRQGALVWRKRKPLPTKSRCAAVIRGGWDRGPHDQGHFGVWLQLP